MSGIPNPISIGQSAEARWIAIRWLALLLLPVAEALWLSVRIDMSDLAAKAPQWAWLLEHPGEIANALLAGLAAAGVMIWSKAAAGRMS